MNTTPLKRFVYPGPQSGFSYHNHSTYSDGKSTLEEMCRAAKAAGLREFGLSDHFVMHPAIPASDIDWSIELSELDSYFSDLLKMKQELDDDSFTLRMGLEVDFFFENMDQIFVELEKYPLDYLIGSVHYAGNFAIDSSITFWKDLTEQDIDDICREYWEKLLGAAQYGKFLFLGHLDLPKKFGKVRNPDRYLPEAIKVLDAAKATGTGIELNTAGWFKECQEPYPSQAILREAAKREIPVVINPDAHVSGDVDRNFAEAEKWLRESGYTRRIC